MSSSRDSALASQLNPADCLAGAADSTSSRDWAAHASLALLLALGVVCVMDAMIIASLLTPIKNEFGFSDEQIGRLSSLFTFAGIVGAPVFGFLANRLGRKAVLLTGVLLWSVAAAATGLAEGFAGLLLWRIVTGFGEAAYNSLAPSWLADLYRPKWRNLVFSLYMLKNKIGAALALAVGGWVAAQYGWRAAFFVAGVPGLALALALVWVREPELGGSEARAAGGAKAERPDFRASLAVFRSPGYVLHGAALVFFFTAMSVQMWIPAFLHRVHGLANQQASAFLAQTLLFTLPAGLIGGYLSSLLLRPYRWGFPAFLSSTSVIAAAAFTLAYTTADLALAQILIVAAIASFGLSAGTLTTLVVETVPPRLRNSAAAFSVVLTSGVAGVIGPELVGILSDRYSLATAVLVAPACYLAAGLVWLGLAVAIKLSPARVLPSAS
ncbi:MFS transporter [Zoogloea sp. LCSB751]|uniref:MFS transporter n=1 Tax=Zoogloea sp. LCSB751 TaxID=1965277 RepID=UPI0009A53671|nr:MFS transporter [Zoogloea sp. LCSB751]